MSDPRPTPGAPGAETAGAETAGAASRWSGARRWLERVPDLLPALALLATGLARVVPSARLAAHVDVVLALLVFVTALDIEPHQLVRVAAHARSIALLAVLPLIALALGGWGLAQFVHGPVRDGTLALGLAPAEVASVGLIGLMGGASELAIAVLAVSLVLSAVGGPPVLAVLGHAAHGAPVAPLLGRFALVVIVPLAVGVAVRGALPALARREAALSTTSSLIVVVLIFASLSATRGADLASAALIGAAFLALSGLLAAVGVRPLGRRLHRSLALTVAMRDFAVAAALAAAAFGPAAAQVAGIYGTEMLIAGATATTIVRRRNRPEAQARAREQPSPATLAGS
jgi:BASS family bile acid:Na+ symporter